MSEKLSPLDRFAAKVDVSGPTPECDPSLGPCWLWTASTVPAGYGQFSVGDRMVMAHRWLYEQVVAGLPKTLHLDHLCRVRHCVNPDHLDPVSQQENNRRGTGWSGRNHQKTECVAGHPLTPDNIYTPPKQPWARQCRQCRKRRGEELRARRAGG